MSYLEELEEHIGWWGGDSEVINWGASHKGMGSFLSFLWGKFTPQDTM